MDFLSSLFGTKPFSTPSASGGNANSTTPFMLPTPAPKAPVQQGAPLSLGKALSSGGLTVNSVPARTPAPVAQPTAMPTPVPTPAPAMTLNTLPPVGNYTPQNFNVPSVGNTVDSSYLSPGALQDLLDARKAKEAAMISGKNTDFIPTDTLQGKLANQLYQSKLFTPDEQSLIQNGQDLVAQINQKKLAARRQVTQLIENGAITKEQAKGFIEEAERRANTELADLSVQQDSNTAKLTALGLIRQNSVSALEAVSGLIKGSEVSPGSTVFNPITGAQFQGSGASPATASTYASQLFNDDLKTGTAQLTADGQVDTNHYFQKAMAILSGQGGTFQGQGTGMNTGGQIGSGGIGGLPQALQPYIVNGAEGSQYINEDKVPAAQRDFIKQQAANNGVAYLTGEDISKFRNIEVTASNLAQLSTMIEKVNGKGIQGRTIGAGTNYLKNLFQTDSDISAFRVWRDTAINTIQALAGGSGSGFRLNQAEIDTASGNLPTIYDNYETASSKINLLNTFLTKWKSQLLTGNPEGQMTKTGGAATTGGVVNTSVGAINTNW